MEEELTSDRPPPDPHLSLTRLGPGPELDNDDAAVDVGAAGLEEDDDGLGEDDKAGLEDDDGRDEDDERFFVSFE